MGIPLKSLPEHVQAQLAGKPVEAKPAHARCRKHTPHVMNKGERLYAGHLDVLIRAEEIQAYWFEGITLRLSDGNRYTADFVVIDAAGEVWLHDVKGRKGDSFWAEEDAMAKIKSAAGIFPWFGFLIVWPNKSGGWNKRELGA